MVWGRTGKVILIRHPCRSVLTEEPRRESTEMIRWIRDQGTSPVVQTKFRNRMGSVLIFMTFEWLNLIGRLVVADKPS